MAEPASKDVWEVLKSTVDVVGYEDLPTNPKGPILRCTICTSLFECVVPRFSQDIPLWCPECRGEFN